MLSTIGQFIKVFLFFVNLWNEKDQQKAEKKKAKGEKINDALSQTDKKKRASMLNAALDDINSV